RRRHAGMAAPGKGPGAGRAGRTWCRQEEAERKSIVSEFQVHVSDQAEDQAGADVSADEAPGQPGGDAAAGDAGTADGEATEPADGEAADGEPADGDGDEEAAADEAPEDDDP